MYGMGITTFKHGGLTLIWIILMKKGSTHLYQCLCFGYTTNGLVELLYRNLSLGLATKVKACKGVGQEWARESHFMLLGVQESVREWTPTFLSELPLWESESQWTPKYSEGNCKGQNTLDWEFLFIIEKLLEPRCPKWACMTHLGFKNTSYGQKKSQESNCQFDSQPLKVKNCLNFLMYRWRVTYYWKALNKGYNIAIDLTLIRDPHTKLWASKVTRVPILGILGLPLGNPGTKWHLGVGLMARHRKYYKGEIGGFLQVHVVVSLVSLCLLVTCLCTKNAPTTH